MGKVKKLIILDENPNLGFEFQSADGHILDWNKMSRAEQINVLNLFAKGYHFFKGHIKSE